MLGPSSPADKHCLTAMRESQRNGHRFSSLVLGVVKSVPFQMARVEK